MINLAHYLLDHLLNESMYTRIILIDVFLNLFSPRASCLVKKIKISKIEKSFVPEEFQFMMTHIFLMFSMMTRFNKFQEIILKNGIHLNIEFIRLLTQTQSECEERIRLLSQVNQLEKLIPPLFIRGIKAKALFQLDGHVQGQEIFWHSTLIRTWTQMNV